jgi:hypothetical protein
MASGPAYSSLGYFIFEIPSNLILERVGARRWIARIMFTWGILSATCAFITGPKSFIAIRFLLGIAEAGFFPGVVLYFTYWFPDRYRGRIMATLFLAVPIANALANIVSGAILEMDGLLGLRGWQWIFLIEAAPAVILSFVVLQTLIDRPSLAKWLNPDEREWLEGELEKERQGGEIRPFDLAQSTDGFTGCHARGHVDADSHGRLWDDFLLATNCEGSRLIQFDDRRCLGCSLFRRDDRTPDLGLVDRSKPRASMALYHRISHWLCRICGCGSARGLLLVAGGHVTRSGWALRRTTSLLADSDNVPERHGCRRRYRTNQFDRKSWRVCWSIYRRMDKGLNEQLRNSALFFSGLFTGLRC